MSKLVMMSHPELGEAGPVTQRAFDIVWAPKGWTAVKDEKATSTARRSRTTTTKEQE
jgi:hypothetical protein